MPPEPGAPHRGKHHRGLQHDAQRAADPDDEQLGRADRAAVGGGGQHPVDRQRDEHDDVVQHRRPRRGPEHRPRVQDRPEQRAHAVEEDLGQQEVGEVGGERPVGLVLDVGLDEQGRREDGERCRPEEHHRRAGEQLLGETVALVAVLLRGTHQHGDDHAGQDAAEQQLEDDVGQRVRDVERAADEPQTDGGGQREGAQEAGEAADQRRHGHAARGLDQRRVVAVVARRAGGGDGGRVLLERRAREQDGLVRGVPDGPRRERGRPVGPRPGQGRHPGGGLLDAGGHEVGLGRPVGPGPRCGGDRARGHGDRVPSLGAHGPRQLGGGGARGPGPVRGDRRVARVGDRPGRGRRGRPDRAGRPPGGGPGGGRWPGGGPGRGPAPGVAPAGGRGRPGGRGVARAGPGVAVRAGPGGGPGA